MNTIRLRPPPGLVGPTYNGNAVDPQQGIEVAEVDVQALLDEGWTRVVPRGETRVALAEHEPWPEPKILAPREPTSGG